MVLVDEDSEEAIEEALERIALMMGREKCIRPYVLIVNRTVKFHSNQQKVSQFIAENVIQSIRSID
jgi:hypothetical protein